MSKITHLIDFRTVRNLHDFYGATHTPPHTPRDDRYSILSERGYTPIGHIPARRGTGCVTEWLLVKVGWVPAWRGRLGCGVFQSQSVQPRMCGELGSSHGFPATAWVHPRTRRGAKVSPGCARCYIGPSPLVDGGARRSNRESASSIGVSLRVRGAVRELGFQNPVIPSGEREPC
jgi:hypothetical protein